MLTPSLFSEIVAAGIEYDSHESDLYLPDCPAVHSILSRFPLEKAGATRFVHQAMHTAWLDVPFAFLPYWEARSRINLPAQS